jgi:hypothetical protein
MAAPTLDQIIKRIALAPSAHIGIITAQLLDEGASLADLLSAANAVAYGAMLKVLVRCPREAQKALAESQLDDLKAAVMQWFQNEGHA